MNNCPKCGSRRISGPFYRRDDYGEFLLYQCNACGYGERAPTLDSQDRTSDDVKRFIQSRRDSAKHRLQVH